MRQPRDIDDVEEFWKLLADSGLVKQDELVRVRESYRAEYLHAIKQSDTVDAVCSFLLIASRLTPWQCEKLRCGQWKGFFLDQYIMVDQIGSDERYQYYLAKHFKLGKYVRITVTRRASENGEGIQYRVE